MRVLVTGADGYIGSLLAPYLADRGHDVVGLDTGLYRDGWLYHDRVHTFPAVLNKDIRHADEQDLAGFDAVAHLAELSNDPLGQFNPDITLKINHEGSIRLAQLCREAGVRRFIYTSSCSVYGAGSDGWKDESSDPNPQTAYAKCKVLVERDVSELANEDFTPTFLRNATAFGPSPRMRFDIVLNNLAGLAWSTNEITLTSDGTPWRPMVHVLDICQAIACALESPAERVHNQKINVGDTRENYRIRDLSQIVADTFPGCNLTIGKSDGDNRSYRVNFDKIQQVLPNFKRRFSVVDGAVQLRKTFEQIDMTQEVFEFRSYTRLKQLQYLLRTKQLDDSLFWIK